MSRCLHCGATPATLYRLRDGRTYAACPACVHGCGECQVQLRGARELSYDERAYLDRVRLGRARYVAAHGEPPASLPGARSHLDACERLGCICTAHGAWACSGALDQPDGACPCTCHPASSTPTPTEGAR